MKSFAWGRLAYMLLPCLLAAIMLAGPAMAQLTPSTPTPLETAAMFGTETGDSFTSVFLNQMFGPLFPPPTGVTSTTVFSLLIGYFNIICLVLGGLLFFWNATVGVLQSAHEGVALGQRWSTLWAPLRVIFAVGLLAPVPNLGGYNLAQAGVAYVVRGSTNIASSVWSTAAVYVIDGVAPITAEPPKIDPQLIYAMFDNMACTHILNAQIGIVSEQFDTAGSTVRWVTGSVNPDMRGSRISYMSGDDGQINAAGICGVVKPPAMPHFIENISETATIDGIPGSARAAIRERFIDAHARLINTLENGQSGTVGVSGIVLGLLPMAQDNGQPIPDISSLLIRLYDVANEQFATDMNEILDLAVGVDRNGQAGRDALKARILGSCATTAAGATNPGECYGEGWIGAGSWYLMLAQLNNEIATLTKAKPIIDVGTFIADTGAGTRAAYIAAGGYEGMAGNVFSGQDERAADRGFAPYEESALWMSRIKQAYVNSTAGMAVQGFPMSHNNMQALTSNTAKDTSFADSILEYIPYLGAVLDEFGLEIINWTSPANFAADPMIGLINLGQYLLSIAALLMGVGLAGGWLTGGAIAVVVGPLSTLLVTSGGMLAFVLPMMPFFYWVLAVTGYFLLIVEAVVAVNLWAIGHMRLDGEGVSGEAGRMGWLMILSLTMTPILMIFGFLIGMTIFRVTSALVGLGIGGVYAALMGGNPMVKLFGVVIMSVMISLMYMAIIERSFSLVSEFPGRVLRWMGADANITNGDENRVRMAAAGVGASLARGGGSAAVAATKYGAKHGLSREGDGSRDSEGNLKGGGARQALDRLRTGVSKGGKPQNDGGGAGAGGTPGGTPGGGSDGTTPRDGAEPRDGETPRDAGGPGPHPSSG